MSVEWAQTRWCQTRRMVVDKKDDAVQPWGSELRSRIPTDKPGPLTRSCNPDTEKQEWKHVGFVGLSV